MKQIIVKNVPEKIHTGLKVQAAKEGRAMQEILLRLVADYLEYMEVK